MTVVNFRPPISGKVVPPTDLQPAIEALTQVGRNWLKFHVKGREILPRDISLAADYERGELKQ